MIFFRTQTVRIQSYKRAENFLLFARLTAFFEAPVEALSGMTVNLKDVDRWMIDAQINASVSTLTEALKLYEARLRQSSAAFQKVKLTFGDFSIEFDGSSFLRTYEVKTWFRENSTWVQRPCSLKTEKSLSLNWRKRLNRKKWSSPDAFAQLLGNYLPHLKSVEVHRPEIQGSEKFQF